MEMHFTRKNNVYISYRFALNVIGTVVFGLEVDTITNPDDSFRKIEKIIKNPPFINSLKIASVFLCPK